MRGRGLSEGGTGGEQWLERLAVHTEVTILCCPEPSVCDSHAGLWGLPSKPMQSQKTGRANSSGRMLFPNFKKSRELHQEVPELNQGRQKRD